MATPGDFTGYGFDQCLAPTQKAMNRWLKTSPFLAVGIYISGTSRACREQPNLTPEWVSAQLAKGWRLLPITLGPQASCQPRFPRYDDDVKIDPTPGADKAYAAAYAQGLAEASTTVTDAQALGIVAGSTLWYDLEGFDHDKTHCRESALRFLSGWTTRLHELGYVSGVYSSVGSGIKALDDARVMRPGLIVLPDRIWLARWDGVANTSSSYIREDGWRPGGRMKQYQGGHNETWGGVTINIDRNYLDLGQGSVAAPETHCGGTRVDFKKYTEALGNLDRSSHGGPPVPAQGAGLPGRPIGVREAPRPPPSRRLVAAGARLQGHHDVAAQALDGPARAGCPSGAEDRLGRRGRLPPAAGAQRGQHVTSRRHRRVRCDDGCCCANVAAAGRTPGDGRHRSPQLETAARPLKENRAIGQLAPPPPTSRREPI